MIDRYFLIDSMSFPKGISQVYILITFMPEIISFIKRIRLSVIVAVLFRCSFSLFPNHAVNKTILLKPNYFSSPIIYKLCIRILKHSTAMINNEDTPISCHKKYVTAIVCNGVIHE